MIRMDEFLDEMRDGLDGDTPEVVNAS